MKNPTTQNIRSIFIYSITWVIILLIHTATLHVLYGLPLFLSFIDGLVFNTIYALIGVALWYPVFYNDFEKKSILTLFIHHLSIMSLTLIFWISIGNFILKSSFNTFESYINLIENGYPWRIFTGVFLYFGLVMIYYLFIYVNNLREHIIQESLLREKINENELQTLRSQINPHFLFNSLNSISSLTLSNPDKAHEMIIKLSGFLRYSLAHDPNNLIALKQEIENLESYIAVEKVRFGNKLIFIKEINEECHKHKVPFLILQPLIENAIKHGVYESLEPITIKVLCEKIENKQIKITIENNFDPQAIPLKGTGTGMKNIKERLKIIYQLNDLFTFEKSKHLFKVVLVIPHKPAFRNM